jgi:hypothetical protein
MHADHRQTKKKFAREIPVTDGIDTILAHARKTEVTRDALAIENDSRTGKRAGSECKHVRSREAITKPTRVARKSLHLPKQIMRESDRLRALQMCVAGH